MLGLGPHASFILAAYSVTFVAIAALVVAMVRDDRKQRHRLAELERQGITRRSAVKTETGPLAPKRPRSKKASA